MLHTPEQWQLITDVFIGALQQPPMERLAWIQNACSTVPSMGGEVLRLIDCDARAGEFLDFDARFSLSDFVDEPASSETSNTIAIRGYEICEQIGRGGQGAVFRAIQLATKREVAIKVLLAGSVAGDDSFRRFRREFELVASLRHPNIVVVFDVGETADGQPYAVMDHVSGRPLNDYLQATAPPRMEILRLFESICGAVAYAHQNHVVHRDLKPSNILVDADGTPRILDFGLAKHLGAGGDSLVSVGIFGTPKYMSPEQTKLRSGEIDRRSDVYALGVILYESLTGGYPYPVDGEIFDVLRHVARSEPMPLNRAMGHKGASGGDPSKRGMATPAAFDRELETIVGKALEKAPERRYETATELRDDLRRYLNREPINAIRPSLTYRIRKYIKRHWAPLSVATVVFALAIALVYYVQKWQNSDRGWRRSEQLARSESVRRLMSEAALERFTDPESAAEKYASAIERAPEDPEPRIRLADLYLRESRPEDARKLVDASLIQFPNCGPLYLTMWRLLQDVDADRAEVFRRKGIERLPDDASLYIAMGLPEAESDQAIGILTKLLQSDGVNFDARWERAWRYFRLGKFEEMLKDAEHLSEIIPNSATAWNLVALASSRIEGREEETFRAYDKSIALAPDYAGTYVNRAEFRFALFDSDGAVEDCRLALDLQPGWHHALSMLARFYLIDWRHEDAWKCCNDAIRAEPSSSLAYRVRGELRILTAMGYAEIVDAEAGDEMRSLAVRDLRNWLSLNKSAVLSEYPLLDLSEYASEFVSSAENFIEHLQNGEDQVAHMMVGDYFLHRDEPDAALAAYERAEKGGNPNVTAAAYRRQALVHEGRKSLSTAVGLLGRAIDVLPEDGRAYFERARIYRKLGEYRDSLDDFRRASERLSEIEFPMAGYELGMALMLNNEIQPAIAELEKYAGQHNDPDCDLRLWELYRRRGSLGDAVLAAARLDAAESAIAADGQRQWLERIVKMLRGDMSPDDCLAAAEDPTERAATYYLIGAAAQIKSDLDAARTAFRSCVELGQLDVVEHHLAAVHQEALPKNVP